MAGVAGFEPTNDGVRGDFEGKIDSQLPKSPRSNFSNFTANSNKKTFKMPDICFSLSVTHFCSTSQNFPNVRSRDKALAFHARRHQCRHASRVCSEEYAFFIIRNNDGKVVFLIETAHVVIPVRFQSGDNLDELHLSVSMDSTLLHKKPLCFIPQRDTEKAHRTMGFLIRLMFPHRSAFGTLRTQVAVRSKGLSLAHSLW